MEKLVIYGEHQIEEARQLQKRAQELHMAPIPLALWEAEHYDKEHRMKKHILAKSNSYTRNGLNLIAIQCGLYDVWGTTIGPTTTGCKSTAGTAYGTDNDFVPSNNTHGNSSWADGGAVEIQAGYSDTAEALTDYILGSAFGTGSNENQLTKGSTTYSCLWSLTPAKRIAVYQRIFSNTYSAAQTIKEMGFVFECRAANNVYKFLMLRDVLETPIVLAVGDYVRLSYRFETLYE